MIHHPMITTFKLSKQTSHENGIYDILKRAYKGKRNK
jgi:hypothetical protein